MLRDLIGPTCQQLEQNITEGAIGISNMTTFAIPVELQPHVSGLGMDFEPMRQYEFPSNY